MTRSKRQKGGKRSRSGERKRGKRNNNGCYRCGKVGHIAHNCPDNPDRGSSAPSVPTTQERRFFDKITKDEKAKIESSHDSIRFFQAANSFADQEGLPSMVYRLVDPVTVQAGALRKALEFIDTGNSVLKDGFLPFLELLGREELNKPVYKRPLNELLLSLYKLPFLMALIKAHLNEKDDLNMSDKTTLTWFMTKIALVDDRARNDDVVLEVSNILEESHASLCQGLKTILSGSHWEMSLSNLRAQQAEQPGGRHDNDPVDYRSIQIIPTKEEFMCEADAYLPKPPTGTSTEAPELLDRQFRLVREDLIGPARDELYDQRKQQRDLFFDARVSRVESGAPVFKVVDGEKKKVGRSCDPCICFTFRIPNWHYVCRLKHQKEKEEYWEHSRRVLPKDALVCLLREENKVWKPVRFGTIRRREVKELADKKPLIGISFMNRKDIEETLKERFVPFLPPTRLMVVSTDLFAYQPILQALQVMDSIPFEKQLLHGRNDDCELQYDPSVPPDLDETVKKLDPRQLAALNGAMSSPVAMIHGPPGTGKTFLGVLLARSILATTSETILIVCYTNHALDDLLEDFITAGITSIVRLGGRSKNERIAEYNLLELTKSGKAEFNREQKRRYASIMDQIENAQEDVKRLDKICSREVGAKWWRTVGPFLKDNHLSCWRQLSVDVHYKHHDSPDGGKNGQDALVFDGDKFFEAEQDNDGFEVVGRGAEDRLWKLWLKGRQPSKLYEDRKNMPLWSMTKAQRDIKKALWQQEMYAEEFKELSSALSRIDRRKSELQELRRMQDTEILSKARIIGCTTTKAAMSKSILDHLSPGVVLVEEAAEIMEAHIITSLSSKTKHLIMIGDHKQLRPKAQNFSLTVEAGRGLDFNKSMFERLAETMPPFSLSVQHRMHPEISAIPRLITYPDLRDAEAVSERPMVRGLSTRLAFINHSAMEDKQDSFQDRVESISRTNSHEVGLVKGVVRYMLQQGYKPGDLVVLTPYLGQLLKLKNVLASICNVFVDDLDVNDLRRNGEDIRKNSQTIGTDENSPLDPVRVATIDNYQGEEADIVIVSLVRSNPEGTIGFLRECERVNVLLSRAKCGEIIIGNLDTFTTAKGSYSPLRGGPLWKRIAEHLEENSSIFTGLPTACQRHGTTNLITSPDEFQLKCPHGGCSLPCGKLLSCNHPCPNRCHVGECGQCFILVEDRCSYGHVLIRQCGAEKLPSCTQRLSWKCPQGHHVSGECWKGKFSISCAICESIVLTQQNLAKEERKLQLEMENEQAVLQKKKSQLAEVARMQMHERDIALVQREIELADQSLQDAEHVKNSTGTSLIERRSQELLRNVAQVRISQFPDAYKESFGTTWEADATKSFGPKMRRKLSQLLVKVQCCEVIEESESPEKVVLLKATYDDLTSAVTAEKNDKPDAMDTEEAADSMESVIDPTQDEPSNSTTLEIDGPNNRGQTFRDPAESNENTKVVSDPAPLAGPESHEPTKADENTAQGLDLEPGEVRDGVIEEIQPVDPQSRSIATQKIGQDHIASKDCSDESAIYVIDRYCKESPLAADDLLDELQNTTFRSKPEYKALRAIIRRELDPSSSLDTFLDKDIKSGLHGLSQALCNLAQSMMLSSSYPLQARQCALHALESIERSSLSSRIPAKWISEAEALAKYLPTTETVKPSKPDSSSIWKDIETSSNFAVPAVMRDSILPMIGLEAVKLSLIDAYHHVKIATERGESAASSYNVRFEGNPGTGKTSMCRQYGTFLQQLSILPEEATFKEISAAKLINEGVSGLKKLLENVSQCGGGVVFVDEAYQLVEDREGKKVLDMILPLVENLETTEYGKIVWVFAGYKKEMEKLFDHNPGLPSRFPHRYIFNDYTDKELQKIFKDLMEYKVEVPPPKKEARPASSGVTYFTRSSNTAPMKDRFNRKWTYDAKVGWTDEFHNNTVDPNRVGKFGSELWDPNGGKWTEHNGVWTNDSGKTQTWYPGEEKPSGTRKRRTPPFTCNADYLRIAVQRIGRRRGDKGFGNARAMRTLFDRVKDRQAARITAERSEGKSPDIFYLSKVDLLGPDINQTSLENCEAWKELQAMEGLKPVKESIQQLFKVVLKNLEQERRNEPLFEVSLNRLFLGSPGTGKTTVGKLYGKILARLGLLSKGDVVFKTASEFVGDVLGASEKTTRTIIQNAAGKVLIIDEAYSLYSGGSGPSGFNDPYKTAVIDTIVEEVQAKPGADIAVVMIVYKEEMERMMSKVNPGLSRRFQIEDAFHFPDFDDASLLRILMAKAKKASLNLNISVGKRAIRTLASARAKPNFGNAGTVDNLFSKAIQTMNDRDGAPTFVAEDFGYDGDEVDDDGLENLFSDLIGIDEVANTMNDLRSTIELSKRQGKDPRECGLSYNYLFLGSPGTGKTTVARRMAKMFNLLGLLPSDEIKEIKASDLMTGYVGQAGMKTREIFKEIRGGCLFIDEAYQLNPSRGGSFMTEAVDELVGLLTDEEYKDKILVILAGYDNDMEDMLKTNPGMMSRFSERVHFKNFDSKATQKLLLMELDKKDIPLECKHLNELEGLAKRLVSSQNFGNGRDVVTWASNVYKQVAKDLPRGFSVGSGPLVSTLKHVKLALDKMLSSRQLRTNGVGCATAPQQVQPMATESTTAAPSPPPVTRQDVDIATKKDEQAPMEVEADGVETENLFQNIDQKVLKTLQSVLDESGLNASDAAEKLSKLNVGSDEFNALVTRLCEETGMSPDEATEQLRKWQMAQEELKKMQLKLQTESLGARPLWRCGVCGRADKPWIACYVAPYICGYEKVEL